MSEKYDKNLVEKYLKDLKKAYPDTDLHLLEMAILQYLLLDCNPDYKPNENNELCKFKLKYLNYINTWLINIEMSFV